MSRPELRDVRGPTLHLHPGPSRCADSGAARSGSATRERTSERVVTLTHVSSRTGSELGTLGERLAAMKPKPVERPVDPARHVWIKTASGRQAGLLVAWVPATDGKWWGKGRRR